MENIGKDKVITRDQAQQFALMWRVGCQNGPRVFRMRDGPQWYEYIRSMNASSQKEFVYEAKFGKGSHAGVNRMGFQGKYANSSALCETLMRR